MTRMTMHGLHIELLQVAVLLSIKSATPLQNIEVHMDIVRYVSIVPYHGMSATWRENYRDSGSNLYDCAIACQEWETCYYFEPSTAATSCYFLGYEPTLGLATSHQFQPDDILYSVRGKCAMS